MKARIALGVTGMLSGFVLATVAGAVDVGDPVFKKDLPGVARVELLYEKYDRKAEIKTGDIKLSGSGVPGGSVTVAGDDDTDKADVNQYIARASFFVGDKATVYVDGGIIDDKDADSTAYIVGAGAQFLAYDARNLRFSAFVAAHYVPPFDVSEEDFDPDLGRSKATGDESWWEAGAGVTASGILALDENMKIIPYAGLMFSVLRGKMNADIDFPDSDVKASADADIEEDQPLIGGLGGRKCKRALRLRMRQGRLPSCLDKPDWTPPAPFTT